MKRNADAIAAYRRYLELEPRGSAARAAEKAIEDLEALK
jgi:hypothetical protein